MASKNLKDSKLFTFGLNKAKGWPLYLAPENQVPVEYRKESPYAFFATEMTPCRMKISSSGRTIYYLIENFKGEFQMQVVLPFPKMTDKMVSILSLDSNFGRQS